VDVIARVGRATSIPERPAFKSMGGGVPDARWSRSSAAVCADPLARHDRLKNTTAQKRPGARYRTDGLGAKKARAR